MVTLIHGIREPNCPPPPRRKDEAFKLNTEKTVIVSTDVEWLPISTVQFGKKVQLHTIFGTATYGEVNAKNVSGFNAWAPAPKRPKWLLDLMAAKK